jgi:hypothetical protein
MPSARILRANSGFTGIAVLALALGIGANTAIFTLVDAILPRLLPFPDPDRLVMVWEGCLAHRISAKHTGPGEFLRLEGSESRLHGHGGDPHPQRQSHR